MVLVVLEVLVLGLLLGLVVVLDEVDCAVMAMAVRMVIARIVFFMIELSCE